MKIFCLFGDLRQFTVSLPAELEEKKEKNVFNRGN
jgi:hypothetical protein